VSLPIFHTQLRELSMLQTQWSSAINPVLNNPISNGVLLSNVVLTTGANVINHTLGRKLQGWTMTRIRASATFYDTQDTNTMPELTLQLNASGNVTVDIYCF
jgi:hypothetical protein